MGVCNSPVVIENSIGGKCTIKTASFLCSRVCWAIAECERLKGSPGTTSEITVVFHHNYTKKINQGYMSAFLQELYREDRFYADKQHLVWSMNGPDGSEERATLERMSERFHRLFPGYIFDKNQRVVAGPSTKVINLKKLMGILKSSDESLWEESRWMFDGKFRFLDKEPNKS